MRKHSATTVPESQAAGGGIPIDLAPLLTPYRQHQRLMIRVVHLPARAELSKGVKNEDASWSLTPADLDGLALLLPDDSEPPPGVAVRIVVIDKNENASIVGQFEVPLPRSARQPKSTMDSERAAALDADWRRRMDRRAAAAQRLAKRKTALALAAAETQWQAASEARLAAQAQELERSWQQKLTAERSLSETAEAKAAEAAHSLATLAGELEDARARIAAGEAAEASQTGDAMQQAADAEARLAQALEARLAQALEARLAQELEARITAARADWEQAGEARIAAAAAEARRDAEAAAATRLEEAQATWRREAERDLEAARQQAVEAEATAQRLEANRAEAEAQWQMESETRLANQEQVLELAWLQKLADARSARDAAEARTAEATRNAAALSGELEAALARLAAAEAGLAGQAAEAELAGLAAEAAAAQRTSAAQEDTEEANARVAREVEVRLATARSAWRKESEAGLADAVGQAVRRAEAVAEARLRQAREDWDREAQKALAVAEGKWKAEAAKRLATAQAEWNRNSEAMAAAGRRTLRHVARRQGRSRLWRRAGQLCVVAGCVAAAVLLYAAFKPLLWQWAPQIVALASELGATALAELQSLAADLLARL